MYNVSLCFDLPPVGATVKVYHSPLFGSTQRKCKTHAMGDACSSPHPQEGMWTSETPRTIVMCGWSHKLYLLVAFTIKFRKVSIFKHDPISFTTHVLFTVFVLNPWGRRGSMHNICPWYLRASSSLDVF